MSAQEAYEHIETPKNEPVTQEAAGAKIIPFPVTAGAGQLAVGGEIAVHQGSGTERYLARRTQTLSVVPNSHEYHQRARELRNR